MWEDRWLEIQFAVAAGAVASRFGSSIIVGLARRTEHLVLEGIHCYSMLEEHFEPAAWHIAEALQRPFLISLCAKGLLLRDRDQVLIYLYSEDGC